jgi:hypothetical protein
MGSRAFGVKLACFFFVSAVLAVAQGDVNSVSARLLQDRDPRQVAWGAWYAAGAQDDSIVSMLQEKLERWDPAERHRAQAGLYFYSMSVILDTLIQRGATATPAGITNISYAFPDQALILTSRLPSDDAEPILLSWYEEGMHLDRRRPGPDTANRLMLARVAAMMLTRDHPAEISGSLLNNSVDTLVISVPDSPTTAQDRCLVDCTQKPPCAEEELNYSRIPSPPITSAGVPEEGVTWPPIYQYTIEENRDVLDSADPAADRPPLVEIGGDRITYRRARMELSLNYCYSPAPLSAVTRHHLLAAMLNTSDDQVPWQARANAAVQWQSDSQFLSDVGQLVSQEEARLAETVKKLSLKGLLTRSQTESIRPRLSVVVFDDRRVHATMLPDLPITDPRTTWRVVASP